MEPVLLCEDVMSSLDDKVRGPLFNVFWFSHTTNYFVYLWSCKGQMDKVIKHAIVFYNFTF